MPTPHRMLAAVVAVCWGLNFIAIDASLDHFPPFFLAALRFAVIAVPTVLLVPRPAVATRWLVGYGLGFGTFQFLFLYWGMTAGMPTGLASLVLQASAPFTVLLGTVLLRTPLTSRAAGGVGLACAGLATVGWQRAAGPADLVPFLLVLAGGLAWAFGNLCTAQARPPNPWHLALWMSVVPPVPLLALALTVEGPARIGSALTTWEAGTTLPAVVGLAYTALVATVLGSGLWSWLMARHPASAVAPFSMLVPVVGMSSAWLLLGERVAPGEFAGAVAVVSGVLIATAHRRPREDSRVAGHPSSRQAWRSESLPPVCSRARR
ncbi:EamA family transporter [Nocardioides panacisoli]|uniref:EamA family transporter n=1 Tax=Nocardioides panacisoli TaxID=627624 RepID=UPI001C630A6D|nr:EamA family transporter [Nocardioides panacisoli]QYJ04196.1 EamA family transporter [Nocardioides panacisoli]